MKKILMFLTLISTLISASNSMENEQESISFHRKSNFSDNYRYELMDLPEEINLNIINCLTIKDIGRISQVSHYWNEIAKSVRKHSIIVIGDSGAGISTFAHLLAGINLNAVESKYGTLALEAERKLFGIEIGGGFKSITEEPCKVLDSKHQRIIWDCPGFYSTGGLDKDFKNALSIHKLLTGSIKVIMLLSHGSFNCEYGISVMKTFSKVTEIFSHQTQLQQCLYFVCSKIPDGLNTRDLLLNNKERLLSFGYTIPDNTLNLINYLLEHPNHIADFKLPAQKGIYIPSDNLKRLIENKEYINDPEVKIPTSGISTDTGWLTPEELRKKLENYKK